MKHAFTLIELLVVMAIIAILAALLMPALERARESARRAVCVGQMRQVAFATHLYAEAHKGRTPVAQPYEWWPARWNSYLGLEVIWWPDYYPDGCFFGPALLVHTDFLPAPEVLYCPSVRQREYAFDGYYGWGEIGPAMPDGTRQAAGCNAYISSTYYYRCSRGWPLAVASMRDMSNPPYIFNTHNDRGTYALMADLFSTPGWNHIEGYNTLYLDGAVLWVADKDAHVPAVTGWVHYGQFETSWLTYFDRD